MPVNFEADWGKIKQNKQNRIDRNNDRKKESNPKGLVLGKGRRYSFYGGERNAEERNSSLLSRLHKALPSGYRCKRPSAKSNSRTRRQTLQFLYKETEKNRSQQWSRKYNPGELVKQTKGPYPVIQAHDNENITIRKQDRVNIRRCKPYKNQLDDDSEKPKSTQTTTIRWKRKKTVDRYSQRWISIKSTNQNTVFQRIFQSKQTKTTIFSF